MPNTTTAKVYDYTNSTVIYLPQDAQLPVGEAGSDSMLLFSGCSTVNDMHDLLGGNFTLSYRAANGNIVICDNREVITPVDVHSLQSHSKPTLQWFQRFVWNINHEEDISRKKDTLFCPAMACEIIDTSNYDTKTCRPRNGLMLLVNKGILPANFGAELFVGGIAQAAKTQSTNREAIFDALTSINTRPKRDFGRVAYEILHTDIKMTVSLQGHI